MLAKLMDRRELSNVISQMYKNLAEIGNKFGEFSSS